MKPVRQKLVNYRSYKNQEVFFPLAGTVGIYGLNGSGKSTLMDHRWVLYGAVPKGVTKDMLRYQQAEKGERTYVELDFIHEEKFVEVRRDLKSNNKTFVKVNGAIQATGVTAVNQFIEGLFHMNADEFSACYYAQQREFDKLVNVIPSERIEAITNLFSIEAYDLAREKGKEEKNQLLDEKEKIQKSLTVQDGDEYTQQKISELTMEIQSTKTLINELKEKKKQSDHNYKNLLVEKTKGEKDYIQFQNWMGEKRNLDSQIESLIKYSLTPLEQKLSQRIEKREKQKEFQTYVDKLEPMKKRRDKMSEDKTLFQEKIRLSKEKSENEKSINENGKALSEITQKENQYKDVEKKLTSTKEKIEQSELKVTKIQNDIAHQKAEIKVIKERFNENKEAKKQLEELGKDADCPTCKNPLGDHYEESLNGIKKEMLQNKNQYIVAKKNLESFEEELSQENKTLKELKQALDEQQKMNSEKIKLEQERISGEKELQRLETVQGKIIQSLSKLEDVDFDQKKYDKIMQNVEKIEKIRDKLVANESLIKEIPEIEENIKGLQKQIEQKKETIRLLSEQIKQLQFNETAYSQLMNRIEAEKEQMDKYQDEQYSNEKKLFTKEENIKTIQKVIKERKKSLERIQEIDLEVLEIETTQKFLKDCKISMLATVRPDLEFAMGQFLKIITNGKFSEVELDEKYNVYVYRMGERNTLSFYSVGNQDLIALCLRFAISKNLADQKGQYRFGMMVMDEVFIHQDTQRQAKMIEMMRSLNKTFEQIFLISHSESTKNSFDYILNVKETEKGYSVVEWETPWEQEKTKKVIEQYKEKFEKVG